MEPYIGQILLVPYSFAPVNWAICDGSLLQISYNEALYTLLGTTFGGDGQTTFALPDLRSRVPVGVGSGPGLSAVTLGEVGGAQMTTLLTSQLPTHIHAGATGNVGIHATSQPGDSESPGGLSPAVTVDSLGANVLAYAPADGQTQMAGSSGTTNPAGGSQPIDIQAPSLALQYIICMNGIYPQRP